MIKSILVGLDPDEDTVHATEYAVQIAARTGAVVTGLAVVDEGSLEAAAAPELYLYKAPLVREDIGAEVRKTARQLIERFEQAAEEAGIEFADTIEEGVPFERILEDTKYHDLVVLGREPHFFYHQPDQRTDTLEKVVTRGSAPALVVTEPARPVNRVLIADDGSVPAARAMQQFVQLQPFGETPALEIVHVRSRGERAREESQLLLRLGKSYCRTHGFEVTTTSLQSHGSPGERILSHARESEADVIVAGAHAVSRVEKWVFGSTTQRFLSDCDLPLFVYH